MPSRYCDVSLLACLLLALGLAFLVPAVALADQGQSPVIEQLQAAKQRDLSEASDPSVSPRRQADCRDQARLADLTIRQLSYGFAVPQSQIREATEVPPPSVRAEKVQLIEQLRQAVARDQRAERLLYLDDPVGLDRLHLAESQASSVIERIQIDEFVPWSEIASVLDAR